MIIISYISLTIKDFLGSCMKVIARVLRIVLLTFCRKWSVRYIELIKNKYADCKSYIVDIDELSINTLIIAEDHRFYLHDGIDILAITRALMKTFLLGKLEGGSTIEQQLSRTITKRYQKNLRRKVIELCHASLIGLVVPKNEIPSMYLYYAYFGTDMEGYYKAIKHLRFVKEPFNISQACELIARLKYPQPQAENIKIFQKIELRVAHIKELYCKRKSGVLYVKE